MKACPCVVVLCASLVTGCSGNNGPACGSHPANPVPGNSLRVLAFNVQLIPPSFNFGSALENESIDERAVAIAGALGNGFFDVLAFEEAWDEDDGKAHLHVLCEQYPSWVRYVDATGIVDLEDSGLMLYSKFPFEPLPNADYASGDTESSEGADSDRVAFVEYDECDSEDCLAAKGAMLVRLRHPGAARIINFVVTHMQADDHAGTRAQQFAQVRAPDEATASAASPSDLISRTLATSSAKHLFKWPNTEWILVAGDLNINGAGARGASIHPNTATPHHAGLHEWWGQIGEAVTREAPSALYDSWAETTSPADIGKSRGNSRLDHILVSRRTPNATPAGKAPSPDLCVQHTWTPPELYGFSDHRAVAADINLVAPQCNPRLAHVVTAEELGVVGQTQEKSGKKLTGVVQLPGSMQWWRFDEPGTNMIGLAHEAQAAGVEFEFYEETNLSSPLKGAFDLGFDTLNACNNLTPTPLAGRRCESVDAVKLNAPAPGFVRVFNRHRTWTGNYWIAFHKYTCKSKAEACQLMPNRPLAFSFPPPGSALNPANADFPDSAWFKIDVVDQADSGEKQHLRFLVDLDQGSSIPVFEVLDAATSAVINDIGGDPLVGPTTPPTNHRLRTIDGRTKQNGSFLLRLTRFSLDRSLVFKAGWQTNLTLLGGADIGGFPSELVCTDELNPEFGSDEIALQVDADFTGFQTRGQRDFDCNDADEEWPWDAHLGIIRFLDQVYFRLVEMDDASADDISPPSRHTFPMDIDLTTRTDPYVEGIFTWGGGEYHLRFSLDKSRRK